MSHGITVMNVNQCLGLVLPLIKQVGRTVVSRGKETLEIPGVFVTEYIKPYQNCLFDPVRRANPFFHMFESMWILAGDNRVDLPAFFLPNIKDYSDNGLNFHGAYGHRLRCWNPGRVDQLTDVVELLKTKPDTRQAVVSIWNPLLDLGTPSKDIPCNDVVMFKVRDGALNMTVMNRSNDAIWGAYGANAVQFSVIQMWVAAMIGRPVGTYTQVSDSMHVYTDLPLWQRFMDGTWQPGDHTVIDPYESLELCAVERNWFYSGLEAHMIAQQDAPLLAQAAHDGALAGVDRHMLHSAFGRNVLHPMLQSFIEYKNGDKQAAMRWAAQIALSDWRLGTLQWLEGTK